MEKVKKLSKNDNAFFDSNVDYLRSTTKKSKIEKRKVRALPDLEAIQKKKSEGKDNRFESQIRKYQSLENNERR